MNKHTLIFVFLIIASALSAQFKKYTYSRTVKGILENAYYVIPLSPEILAKSQSNFSDFRVFQANENDTIETPYTLNWKDEEIRNMEYSATLVDVSYKPNCCSFVTLKFNEPKEINEIKLEVAENNFDKLLKIEGSIDNKDWKTIKEDMRIVGFGFDDYKYTKLNFGICTYRYFRLTVDNSNSKAINITGATTYYNHYLTGSYTLITDVKVLRSEKKTEGKNYQTARGKTVSVQEANETELKVILPYQGCIHHIIIRSKDSSDFYRYISVADDSKNVWRTETFTSLEKDRETVIAMDKVVTDKFVLTIDNKDNQPIKNIEIEVYGQNAELYCKLSPDKNYLLCYSAVNDRAPQYDLTYFSNKIPEPKNKAVLGEAISKKEGAKTEPIVKQEKWLWITLAILVLLIGGFAFSLMKKVKG